MQITNVGYDRDAGLILSAYLNCLVDGIENPYKLNMVQLQRILLKQQLRVLELGAGCGIVGITLAQCFPNITSMLTDLPEAEDITKHNISTANSLIGDRAKIEYQSLDWAEPLPQNLKRGDLDLVLVADCTYNPDSVPDLVRTLSNLVTNNRAMMILLAMKVRHESEMVFFDLMAQHSMTIVDKVPVPLPLLGGEPSRLTYTCSLAIQQWMPPPKILSSMVRLLCWIPARLLQGESTQYGRKLDSMLLQRMGLTVKRISYQRRRPTSIFRLRVQHLGSRQQHSNPQPHR